MAKLIDITGQRFGNLTVLEATNKHNVRGIVIWKCQCDCGKITEVVGSSLRNGSTKSCGCEKIRKLVERSKKYNQYDLSGEYGICYLTNGGSFIFDKEDFDKIKDDTWFKRDDNYVKNTKGVRVHRIIMNCPKGKLVDHINHNPLDNRKSNLRICNYAENSRNRKVLGVYYDKSVKLWKAKIKVEYKSIYLGASKDKEEAIKLRKEGERKYFGEFAYKEG